MTFFIALFILVMQFLWRYVDELVGKGLEVSVLAQLLFYATVQMVPMALPLAILLASLMTFGSLGENYELTALKSAGISLPRIMMPLIILTIVTSYGAFKFSNNVMPYANLKLYSLLFDVRQARPELDIKEKVFYSGIDGFTIKINEKNAKTNMLHTLMIYDHRGSTNSNTNVTVADSGKIKIAKDKSAAIFTLYNGVSFNEKIGYDKRPSKPGSQTFEEDHFKEQSTFLTLQGFDFSRTDEGLFKTSDRMKNIAQLEHDRDSITLVKNKYAAELTKKTADSYFMSWQYIPKYVTKLSKKEISKQFDTSKKQSIDSLFNSNSKKEKITIIETAIRLARANKQTIDNELVSYQNEQSKIISHKMEWHRKFTLSFACLIFFFIGAPLGAIIRKGGLGMPIVISVLFFIIYFVIDTTGAKMAREGIWEVYIGMWLSSAIILPIGAFLTYKSATDSTILNADVYYHFFEKIKTNIQTIFSKKSLE